MMSFTEYEIQFTKLSKFALELVATKQKVEKTVYPRVKPRNLGSPNCSSINTFGEALERSQRVESVNPNWELSKHKKGACLVITLKNLERMHHLPKLVDEWVE